MNIARSLIFAAFSLCIVTAQVALAQRKPPVVPQSLADALRGIAPPPNECVIAVDAEHVQSATGDAADLENDASAIAARHGRIAQPFGGVIAVAPPTMTVLNTDFGQPDIYASLSAGDALKMLCATLTDSQWAMLTGKSGLGAGDLTSKAQASLFAAILGPGNLKVSQGHGESLDLTADKPLARIRVALRTDIMVPEGPSDYESIDSADIPGMPKYTLFSQGPPQTADYGQPASAEFPNAPKPSGLDYASAAMQTQIPLGGLKTVGDLVYRIGTISKTELYVDPHYGSQSLTVVAAPAQDKPDSPPSAKAGDLLQALALCVTGTYRQVGPAYVLTDDLLGIGPRQQMKQDFEDRARALRKKSLETGADSFTAHHGLADLKSFSGMDLSPTSEQIKSFSPSAQIAPSGRQDMIAPFSALTPLQQTAARKIQWIVQLLPNDSPPASLAGGKVILATMPMLELLLPSLPDPVSVSDSDVSELLRPSQAVANARLQAWQAAHATHEKSPLAAVKPPQPPNFASIFAKIPRRAVLLDLKTPADVNTAIAAMQNLGLNELWLTVLEDGHARIPGTKLSDPSDKTDIIAEAVAATKGTGISVYPVLDLLKWGTDAPDNLRDLTVRGENSTQATTRVAQRNADFSGLAAPLPASFDKSLAVSPLSSVVRDSLLSVAAAVGAATGVAGIAWRDAMPPGYGSDDVGMASYYTELLGYGVASRLAFLRADHADPVDLGISNPTGLPLWDSGQGLPPDVWNKFRTAANRNLMLALRAAIDPSAVKPLLVEAQSPDANAHWYGSWDSLRDPLPIYHVGIDMRPGAPTYPPQPAAQAKLESQISLLIVRSEDSGSQASLANYLQQHKTNLFSGFVLQFDGADGAALADFERLAGR